MHTSNRRVVIAAFVLLFSTIFSTLHAQSNSGSITGIVTDPSGAVVPGASVTVQNPVSGYLRDTKTDSAGRYIFVNLPFNSYHLEASASGFDAVSVDASVHSTIAVNAGIVLKIAGSSTTVNVSADDLLEADTDMNTNLDRRSFAKLPLESQSSSLSSLVTLSSPGVTADSNGLFHGLGDHASNSFSVDGQPITDQQSKVFSNQIPSDSIQSIEVIEGAPPAEYGDKTSLVIDVTTRSGQGVTKPTGQVYLSYGSFGSSLVGFDLAAGTAKWGNFVSANGLNTGRFLDGPEFSVFHDKGNEENFFDRVDYQISQFDTLHLNLNYTRSWFQTPNSYDNLNVHDQFGNVVGNTDQHSKIETFNIAPSYTRTLGASAVFNFGAYIRKDAYNYYASGNPLADLGPPSLQRESVSQRRTLLNTGLRSDLSYLIGKQTIKVGALYEQTFLRENFNLGLVDPILNAPCLDVNNHGVAGFTDPSQCAAAGDQPNTAANANAPNSVLYPYFNPTLLSYDLTRGGSPYPFLGHTDVKELALYIDDQIKAGNWLIRAGIRGDLYNGLTIARQAEPRLGIGYTIKPSSTVLRLSYGRYLETPFNENLVLSSTGAENPVINALIPSAPAPLAPGYRNDFHAGLQQAAGKFLVVTGEYVWTYTHNAFDFSVLGNTPITFPIDWNNSKISGPVVRVTVPAYRNFSAFVVLSSVNARFFTPQIAGLGVVPAASATVTPTAFRIDHDERFNQTTHLQYQVPGKYSPWVGFNWRFDSGLVAGSVPCFAGTATCAPSSTTLDGQPAVQMVSNNVFGVPLTADQEAQAGFYCGTQHATPTQALPLVCLASQFGSTLVKVPAPGTEQDDHNPQRIQPRSLFDISLGQDDLFHGDRYKWSAKLTVINLANKVALYNWLSTFSGTHYVTPRDLTAEVAFHF